MQADCAHKRKHRPAVASAALLAGMLCANQAEAALSVFQTYLGNVGVSSDGWGSTTQSGSIQANAPAGSTVVVAFLYSSTFNVNMTLRVGR